MRSAKAGGPESFGHQAMRVRQVRGFPAMASRGSLRDRVVLVAIVATNEVHNLVGCLRSLSESEHRKFHVVICENGGIEAFRRTTGALAELDILRPVEGSGREGTPPVWASSYREFILPPFGQRVTVLQAPRNLGYAGGVNACIAVAADWPWDAVWVLNPDTFPAPGALAALVDRQDEGAFGIVGSRLISAANGRVQTWGGIEWRSWLGRGRLIGRGESGDAQPNIPSIERRFGFISGASMYVSRAYVDAVGVMDEDFFVYSEDVDWCLRRGAFRLGYAHNSVIRHVHGSTSGSSSVKSRRSRFNVYLNERNRILLARKQFGAIWPLFAVLAFAVMSLEYLFMVGSVRQLRIAVEGWFAGIRGETGPPGFVVGGSGAPQVGGASLLRT